MSAHFSAICSHHNVTSSHPSAHLCYILEKIKRQMPVQKQSNTDGDKKMTLVNFLEINNKLGVIVKSLSSLLLLPAGL